MLTKKKSWILGIFWQPFGPPRHFENGVGPGEERIREGESRN